MSTGPMSSMPPKKKSRQSTLFKFFSTSISSALTTQTSAVSKPTSIEEKAHNKRINMYSDREISEPVSLKRTTESSGTLS